MSKQEKLIFLGLADIIEEMESTQEDVNELPDVKNHIVEIVEYEEKIKKVLRF